MAETKETTTEIKDRAPNPAKIAKVAEVLELLKNSEGVVFTEYRGLDVIDMADLRTALGEAGGSYKIYKNTLVRRAVSDLKLSEVEEFLTGPTGLAFLPADSDISTYAKILVDYKNTHDVFVIKGGWIDEKLMLPEEFSILASLPSKQELLGQLAGTIQAPLSKMAALFAAPLQKFHGLLDALAQKAVKEQPAEAAAPPADLDSNSSEIETPSTEASQEAETKEPESEEPQASSEESSAETSDSEEKSDEPETSADEPEPKSDEPEASADEPEPEPENVSEQDN